MPLWFFPALLVLLAVASLVAGGWLLLHSRDVARALAPRRGGALIPGPGPRRASRAAVWAAVVIFNAGWIACILIWVFVIGGEANTVVDARMG